LSSSAKIDRPIEEKMLQVGQKEQMKWDCAGKMLSESLMPFTQPFYFEQERQGKGRR
jgi:hypothetical protein